VNEQIRKEDWQENDIISLPCNRVFLLHLFSSLISCFHNPFYASDEEISNHFSHSNGSTLYYLYILMKKFSYDDMTNAWMLKQKCFCVTETTPTIKEVNVCVWISQPNKWIFVTQFTSFLIIRVHADKRVQLTHQVHAIAEREKIVPFDVCCKQNPAFAGSQQTEQLSLPEACEWWGNHPRSYHPSHTWFSLWVTECELCTAFLIISDDDNDWFCQSFKVTVNFAAVPFIIHYSSPLLMQSDHCVTF
jgi:hypothetical protein